MTIQKIIADSDFNLASLQYLMNETIEKESKMGFYVKEIKYDIIQPHTNGKSEYTKAQHICILLLEKLDNEKKEPFENSTDDSILFQRLNETGTASYIVRSELADEYDELYGIGWEENLSCRISFEDDFDKRLEEYRYGNS